ncbi:MAG: ABC transporter substrate-binding protein, partial [Burkholderiales bacterium]
MRRHCSSIGLLIIAPLTALLAACGRAPVDPNEIRIGFVFDKTGPLEAYMKQTQVGFQMGLDYATDGTFTVAGKKLRVIERDSKGKPDVAKAQLA